ncbi:MAG: Nucleoid-associated protein [Candidatus Aerophobetes bacterium ADurb.Bin490]|jgi:DNA-binding YbaB/EbfC family protein|nr:MAG: Nucleoid-associated protein [Candidatus Aerophobetes bacterium ADurb.Bin490]HNZ29019.1 YbaB/EbfC family nucleoid-associated protein [Candidatus Goldiibacteriota bacterium]HPI03723.1 YbaB/EbfC family nucleoid-associated protein [Candidatus Goldiibacteriota bacterium]HPN64563.1 YbaB/EbfC family nucleoid-associated protein [Candidatus Goldiibacteriota bacterium]HRQ44678.1 YbaB/EbfC family nucleoid-associated protein [Candidatus Goldiibacteriota bacterium]
MNMNQLMKQAQQMQARFAKLQEELKSRTVEAQSGGGAVKVTATGGKEIKEIVIDKELISSGDADMLQDLVLAAVNEALNRAQEMVEEETKKLTGGMNIPGF